MPASTASPEAPAKIGRVERLRPPWLLSSGAHLAALWGFAVLQPTLDVLSQNADLFVARQVQGWPFVSVVVGFALLPPLLLLGIEVLAALAGERARTWVHLFLVWALLALLALYALGELFPSQGLVLVPLAWAVGAGAAFAYARREGVRRFFGVLAPAPLLFLAYFLIFSPSHKLIFPEEAAAAASGARSQTPVVMLILDELPVSSLLDARGRIDSKLFPNFAELADHSTWYRNTTAAADQTEEAVPALLDARRPRHGTLPILPDHPQSVFTLFAGSHEVRGMEHITWLCHPSLCPNPTPISRRMADLASALTLVYAHVAAPGDLPDRLPSIGSTWQEALAARDPKHEVDPDTAPSAELVRHGDAQFDHFLRSLRPVPSGARRPPFYFFHSVLPHVPWKHVPSGRLYTGDYSKLPGLSRGNRWGPDRTLVVHGFQRHLLQASYADRLLGRTLRRLRELGLYDRALVAVTSDHGVSFLPGEYRRAVDEKIAGDVGPVPFFVKAPRQTRARVVTKQLQTIDVVPTVADVLGVRIPWRVDGRPASELPEGGRKSLRILRHRVGVIAPSLPQLERRHRDTVRRKLALFGAHKGVARLYGIGPDRDLVGRALDELRVEPDGDRRVELEDPGDYDSVDLGSRFVPALVEGRVPDGVARVVVALNGRVCGTGPTYSSGGRRKFSVMADESCFRNGDNELVVLAASGTGRTRRLTALDSRR